MANRITLVSCKFENLDGSVSCGFRIFDDYAKTYYNLDETITEDDMELLQLAVDNSDETIDGMLDHISEEHSGILINDTYYEYEEISHIID